MAYKRKRKAPKKVKSEEGTPANGPSPPKNVRSRKRVEPEAEEEEEEVPIKQEEENDEHTDLESNAETASSQDGGSYVIEAIAGVCLEKPGKSPLFLIKWLGYPMRQATWEPIENLNDCEDLQHFQPLVDKMTSFKAPRGKPKGKKKGGSSSSSSAEDYEVEDILGIWFDHEDGQIRFKVKWADYPFSQCTWEVEENLDSCDRTLQSISGSIDYLKNKFADHQPSKKKAGKRGSKRVRK